MISDPKIGSFALLGDAPGFTLPKEFHAGEIYLPVLVRINGVAERKRFGLSWVEVEVEDGPLEGKELRVDRAQLRPAAPLPPPGWVPSNLAEEVFVYPAAGHALPPVIEDLELPVKGLLVKEMADNLWHVKLKPPLEEVTIQVHADQLRPVNCPECGSGPGSHKINCKLAQHEREVASGREAAAYWSTDRMISALFNRTAGKHGGSFGIGVKPDGDFSVMVEYGSEAEDSPMVGAAVYGMAGTLRGALMRAGADAGLWVHDDSPDPGERQRRILILEAPEGEEPITNVFAQDVVQGSVSLVADADEVFVFRGDKGACTKHRDESSLVINAPAVAVQRQPVRTELAPDLEIVDRGRTTGAHIGIPLAYAEAMIAALKIEHGSEEEKKMAAEALADLTDFVQSEGKT